MGKILTLGKGRKDVVGVMANPQTMEERITVLESQLKAMTHAFYSVRRALEKEKNEASQDAYNPGVPIEVALNKDGIPINTVLVGITEQAPFILTVGEDGLYHVNEAVYPSLSSAAEGVGAPLRKSGWRFWKTLDGFPAREVYRKA